MKRNKIVIALLGFILLYACSEEYLVYEDVARLQFGPEQERNYQSWSTMADTLKSFTFVYTDNETILDTVYFDLYSIGKPADTDRPFRIEQMEPDQLNNAVPGIHYLAFDDPQLSTHYMIKAGEVHTRVPVVTLRDPSLKESGVMLEFRLVANEHFETGDPKLIWRKLFITDRLTRPVAWSDSMLHFWGPYSEVKHLFMVQQTGERWDHEMIQRINNSYPQLLFWTSLLKQLLIEYNLANPDNPLTDEFGQLVFFP
jgi:hypothetical protein